MLPIVKLVRAAVDASGLSLRVFAAERRIAYSTLRRYYDKSLPALSQPPRKETLRELSLALNLTLGEVEQAALESLSYRATPGKAPIRAEEPSVLDVSDLSPTQRRALELVVAAMKETHHDRPAKTQADESAAPSHQPRVPFLEAQIDQLDAEITAQEQARKRRITD